MKITKQIKNVFIGLILALMATASYADCVWTSFSRNGVYAYGFEHGTGGNSVGYQLYLGTYIGTISSPSEKIYYNGQYWTVGSYVTKTCLGKNCTSEREEYYACSVAATAFSLWI